MCYNSFNVKKFLIVLTVLVGSILLWNYAKTQPVSESLVKKPQAQSIQVITPQKVSKQYIFIPYWSFTQTIVTDSKDSLIYFGIGVNQKGLEIKDRGYTAIPSFIRLTPNASERILAVRMTDKTVNAAILKDPAIQEKIVTGAVDLARQHGFDGVLLDYETSAFAFESTTTNITSFHKLFAGKVRAQNLLFYVTLYGDTYFQSRPFDIKQIGLISDKVIVMAYDFSKSRGNPGPNFPLSGHEQYGYDFEKMVDDFQKDVDNQKLVITMGYFGYDWRIDAKGESITSGVPLSTNEIKKEFIDDCKYEDCNLERVGTTLEPSIKYKNGSANHIIWFEDEQSVDKKTEFLESKGILEIASWAYSYY